jgi:hypothetical protein
LICLPRFRHARKPKRKGRSRRLDRTEHHEVIVIFRSAVFQTTRRGCSSRRTGPHGASRIDGRVTSAFLSFRTRLPPYCDRAKDATVSDRQLEQTASDPEP